MGQQKKTSMNHDKCFYDNIDNILLGSQKTSKSSRKVKGESNPKQRDLNPLSPNVLQILRVIYHLKNMGWFQISLGHFNIISVPDPLDFFNIPMIPLKKKLQQKHRYNQIRHHHCNLSTHYMIQHVSPMASVFDAPLYSSIKCKITKSH